MLPWYSATINFFTTLIVILTVHYHDTCRIQFMKRSTSVGTASRRAISSGDPLWFGSRKTPSVRFPHKLTRGNSVRISAERASNITDKHKHCPLRAHLPSSSPAELPVRMRGNQLALGELWEM